MKALLDQDRCQTLGKTAKVNVSTVSNDHKVRTLGGVELKHRNVDDVFLCLNCNFNG